VLRRFALIATASASIALSGCATATFGRIPPAEAVAQIKPGETTEAQAIKILGRPSRTVKNPEGKRMLLYMRTESEVVMPYERLQGKAGGAWFDNLNVTLDDRGVVSAVERSSNRPSAQAK